MTFRYSTDEHDEEVGFWELKRGTETLAMLELISMDEGWRYCFFFPEPGFEPYRHLFSRGREREFHQLMAREGIWLESADHQRIPAFTLELEGTGAKLNFPET